MSNFIGPALPPHMCRDREDKNEDDVLTAEISDDEYREEVPTKPADLPEDAYGPALPPGFKPNIMGPPAPFSSALKEDSSANLEPTSKNSEDEEEDVDVVGPMPIGNMSDNVKQQVEQQLENRAQKMKQKLTDKDNADDQKMKRESWMIELPPEKALQFGLGPRQFRMRENAATGDRSVWTDTPELREKKASQKVVVPTDDLKRKVVEDRDQQMEKLTEGCLHKRSKESLLESHQKKLKREKQESSGSKQERRPFDRNIDLQANRFDEAQKKAIFKKAQMLDDRFSRGESKYL